MRVQSPAWLLGKLLPLLLLSVFPSAAQAQYGYTNGFFYMTNGGVITIEGHGGPGGDVTIPDTINGLPVTGIEDRLFWKSTSLTSVTIGSNVTSMWNYAFKGCSLTSITIPDSVITIGDGAFADCTSLTNVTIGSGITSIGEAAFDYCTSLTGVCFQGNAPSLGLNVFGHWDMGVQFWDPVTSYYLPGTTGWASTFGGRPTAPWVLPNPVILKSPNFGIQANGFGFGISWATNVPVVIEASANLGTWLPVSTNTLTNGWSYFSDPAWTNYPARFYRLRSP